MRTQSSLLNLRIVLKPLFTLSSVCMTVGMAQAQAGWFWKAPDHGFRVEVDTDSVPQKSGTAAKIHGEIQYILGNSQSKQPVPVGILDQIEVRAYFPDFTHEVTKHLIIDTKKLTFSYVTPTLRREETNVFTVVVGRMSPESQALQRIETKIEKRISALEAAIRKGQRQNIQASELGKIQRLRDELATIADKIQKRLSSRLETLAKTQLPLQVDNLIAQPGLQSSLVGGFQIDLKANVGSTIAGEKASLSASITNYRQKLREMGVRFAQESEDSTKWIAKFYWSNAQVMQIGPQSLPAGATIFHQFETEALQPIENSEWRAGIYKADEVGNAGKQFGSLALALPIAPDTIKPEWMPGYTPNMEHPYVQIAQPVLATLSDSFGKISQASFKATLEGVITDGTTSTQDVTSKLQLYTANQGESYTVTGELNPLVEGQYKFTIVAQDKAGNAATPSLIGSFRIDRTPPRVTLGVSDHYITNSKSWTLPVIVSDLSPTKTRITQNGVEVMLSTEVSFSVPVILQEGLNIFEIESVDAAGNVMQPLQLIDVVLDTVPPALTDLSPSNGSVLPALSVPLSGKSNERIRSVSANGKSLSVSADMRSFVGEVQALAEGPFQINWEAYDLAGNKSSLTTSYEISQKLLRPELISVDPTPSGFGLVVRGRAGAARAGASISVVAGLFNRSSGKADVDGAFDLLLDYFQSATISAADQNSGKSESAVLTYAVDTRLVGKVLDSESRPLPGVKVSIEGVGSVSPVFTNENGVFQFLEPASTGDQVLVLDGSEIGVSRPDPCALCSRRQFSKVRVSISIGLSQSNILEKPFYLAPLLLDGSETQIARGAPATVRSSHAPGVELAIPADVTTFANGQTEGKINIATVGVERALISPLAFALPSTIVNLEPSGTKFSKRIDLTLPNDSKLPAGTEVAILSLDSVRGIWEIDGAAAVSGDGQKIQTKSGMGISHFSSVYAVPLGPVIREMESKDKIGADSQNGGLSASINLPGFTVGSDNIKPSLIYKSNWAKPTIAVSNLIDIPKQKLIVEDKLVDQQNGSPVLVKSVEVFKCWTLFDCGYVSDDYYEKVEYEAKQSITAAYTPLEIAAQFFTYNLKTDPDQLIFNGPPSRALISFATDASELPSGVYPYIAHYKLKLESLETSTISIKGSREYSVIDRRTGGSLYHKTEPLQETHIETQTLKHVFPSDVLGSVYIQNKIDSEAGRGWKISGVPKLLNPGSRRVLLEEPDGSLSAYAINKTIDTVFDASETGADLTLGVGVSNWPYAYLQAKRSADNNITKVDLSSGAKALETVSPVWKTSGNFPEVYCDGLLCTPNTLKCALHPYSYESSLRAIISLPDGSLIATDSIGAVFKVSGSSLAKLSGRLSGPSQHDASFCSSYEGVTCGIQSRTACPAVIVGRDQVVFSGGTGQFPLSGYADGTADEAAWNKPIGIAYSAAINAIAIADSGNNRVRLYDLSSKTITTIAGNGQTYDSGDGNVATSASLFHPRGVAFDAVGNLYISTERGYVRRVDALTKVITTYAGLPYGDPQAVLADDAPAATVSLNDPFGIVIDDNNNYLYIADRGHNRVVQIDMLSKRALNYAGNGSRGFSGDGGPAINASLNAPTYLGIDNSGNLLIVDSENQKIRRVVSAHSEVGTLSYVPLTQDHSSLSRNSDGTWIRTTRKGVQTTFDRDGLALQVLDRAGKVRTYEYENGLLKTQTEMTGAKTRYFYTGGLLSSISDPAGRTTQFEYTGKYLTSVLYPDGSVQSYTYDDSGLMTSETDQRGRKTEYFYNEWNRLKKIIRPNQSELLVNDSVSATIGNNYSTGQVGELKPFGFGEGEVYDGITDPTEVETKFVKDINGFITKVLHGNEKLTWYKRNDRGQAVEIRRYVLKDAEGIEPFGVIPGIPELSGTLLSRVTFRYNRCGDLEFQEDSESGLSSSQEYQIDSNCRDGNLIKQVDGNGLETTYTYDAKGLIKTKSSPAGSVKYTYNSFGQVETLQEGELPTTTFGYDPISQLLISTVNPDGAKTTLENYANGTGLLKTKRYGNGVSTSFEYDKFNRMTSVTLGSASGQLLKKESGYFADGNIEWVTDPAGNRVSFGYDSNGYLSSIADYYGRTTALQNDNKGNIKVEQDPNGNSKAYEYDSRNRVIKASLPDNEYTYSYDDRGNLSVIQDKSFVITNAYDSGGRLISSEIAGRNGLSDFPKFTVNFKHDAAGVLKEIRDSLSAVPYQIRHDALSRISGVTNSLGEQFTFSYDGNGRLNEIVRPGSKVRYEHSEGSFIKSVSHFTSNGTPILGIQYQRDIMGNPREIDVTRGATTFKKSIELDGFGQVKSYVSTEPGISISYESFTYDNLLNRQNLSNGSAVVYDDRKLQLERDEKYTYSYDKNGNVVKRTAIQFPGKSTRFRYSSENQLIGIEEYETEEALVSKTDFAYDPTGRRAQKRVTNFIDPSKSYTRRYLYHEQNIALVLDGQNQILARYTHSPLRDDDILSVNVLPLGVGKVAAAGGSYVYLKDYIGSVLGIADAEGRIVDSYSYSAFGQLVAGGNFLPTFYAFTGREYDAESELYYYRNRYYDPRLGRFLQRDLVSKWRGAAHPAVINPYTFVGNNPFSHRDPSGSWSDIESSMIYHRLCWEALEGAYDTFMGLATKGMYAYTAAVGTAVTVGVAAEAYPAILVAAGSINTPYWIDIGTKVTGGFISGFGNGSLPPSAPKNWSSIAASYAGKLGGQAVSSYLSSDSFSSISNGLGSLFDWTSSSLPAAPSTFDSPTLGSSFDGYGGVGSSGYGGYSGGYEYGGSYGYSGYGGYSSYSGYSGSTSYNGYSGYTGYSGYSGFGGTSGYSGYTGYSPYGGYSGYGSYGGFGY